MTDGGLGVAFFAPCDEMRYFLPWRPVMVSPIGVVEFFTHYGARITERNDLDLDSRRPADVGGDRREKVQRPDAKAS